MAKPKFKFTDRTYTAFQHDEIDPLDIPWSFSWYVGKPGYTTGLYNTSQVEITSDQSSSTADADRVDRIINYEDEDISSGEYANSIIASNRGWYDIDEPNGGALIFGGNDFYSDSNGVSRINTPATDEDFEFEAMYICRHTAGVTGSQIIGHVRDTSGAGGLDALLLYDATNSEVDFSYGSDVGNGFVVTTSLDLTDAGYHLVGARAELTGTSPTRYTIYVSVDGVDATGVIVGPDDPTVLGFRIGNNTAGTLPFGESNATVGYMQGVFVAKGGILSPTQRADMLAFSQEDFSTP